MNFDGTCQSKEVKERVKDLILRTNYTLVQMNGQRIFGNPPNWVGLRPPKEAVVFIGNLPRNLFEDELVPFIRRAGEIYELRLIMDMDGYTKGFAFVTFVNADIASYAIYFLENKCIRPNHSVEVHRSVIKSRLLILGLPLSKSKDEIMVKLCGIVKGMTNVLVDVKRQRVVVDFVTLDHAAVARRKLRERGILWGYNIFIYWQMRSNNVAMFAVTNVIKPDPAVGLFQCITEVINTILLPAYFSRNNTELTVYFVVKAESKTALNIQQGDRVVFTRIEENRSVNVDEFVVRHLKVLKNKIIDVPCDLGSLNTSFPAANDEDYWENVPLSYCKDSVEHAFSYNCHSNNHISNWQIPNPTEEYKKPEPHSKSSFHLPSSLSSRYNCENEFESSDCQFKQATPSSLTLFSNQNLQTSNSSKLFGNQRKPFNFDLTPGFSSDNPDDKFKVPEMQSNDLCAHMSGFSSKNKSDNKEQTFNFNYDLASDATSKFENAHPNGEFEDFKLQTLRDNSFENNFSNNLFDNGNQISSGKIHVSGKEFKTSDVKDNDCFGLKNGFSYINLSENENQDGHKHDPATEFKTSDVKDNDCFGLENGFSSINLSENENQDGHKHDPATELKDSELKTEPSSSSDLALESSIRNLLMQMEPNGNGQTSPWSSRDKEIKPFKLRKNNWADESFKSDSSYNGYHNSNGLNSNEFKDDELQDNSFDPTDAFHYMNFCFSSHFSKNFKVNNSFDPINWFSSRNRTENETTNGPKLSEEDNCFGPAEAYKMFSDNGNRNFNSQIPDSSKECKVSEENSNPMSHDLGLFFENVSDDGQKPWQISDPIEELKASEKKSNDHFEISLGDQNNPNTDASQIGSSEDNFPKL